MGIYFAIAFAVAFLAIAVVVIVRTALFKPFEGSIIEHEDVAVDFEKAVNDLSEMIKCKTVSNFEKELEDETEFLKFEHLLPKLFPNIYEKCEFERVNDRALLYRYPGKSNAFPTVLMAHYDVVSVEEDSWEKPPFSAVVENGVLWGRGTLDTKCTLNGAMQALESLIENGFVPENDIYLAFSGNEEVNGNGATSIVEIFEKRGIIPGAVIDEGGAVVSNVFPGIDKPCALIGIAEKGMLNVEFTCMGNGGHSSSPKAHTPVGKLSKACVDIENHPFKMRICEASYQMFNSLARRSNLLYRMIFANLWLFAPVLDFICKRNGGEINALLRTTCAFTKMQGSKGINVIPPSASMGANLRILPGETAESTVSYLKKTINNPDIQLRVINSNNPSVVSKVGTEGWNRLVDAINGTWSDAIVSPYLMFACSDSRHWGKISDKVYRFSAMELTAEQRATIHGNNERIPVETIAKTVEFFVRLISNS